MPPELSQVLKGLAYNRLPGFNFPANFLELSFDRVADGEADLSIRPGPHCTEPDGQVNLGAFGVLADIGLAASVRALFGAGTRMATVALSLQFTGAPLVGTLRAANTFDGPLARAAERQGLSRMRLFAGDVLACTCSGTFMAIGGADATPPLPMRRASDYGQPLLAIPDLTGEERGVWARAEKAFAPGAGGSFIQRFWGTLTRRTSRGAVSTCPNGLQISNHVGHVQGGISLALAATTANCALGEKWMMSGIRAFYVSPGIGKMIMGRSRIVHLGARTAVVQTALSNDGGPTALQAISSHARCANAAQDARLRSRHRRSPTRSKGVAG